MIVFKNFSLTYVNPEQGKEIKTLEDFTANIKSGEIITILGPSGCGKTTLLKVIAGLDKQVKTTGQISFFGMSPAELKRHKSIAFAFQNPVLLPWRNVRENVGLPLEIKGNNDIIDVVDDILSLVGLEDFGQAFPHEISGGMQQRANLARALVQHPEVLLMDEPFGSLDEVTRERLNFELLRIHSVHKPTIFFVTHSVTEAVLLGDRVLVLSKRPAKIVSDIHIDIPYDDRNEEILTSPKFNSIVREARKRLTNS